MAQRNFNPRFTKRIRQKLRREMTPQEWKLWIYLKNRQLDGIKFRTQTGIGRYVADFFTFERLLAIELDGNHHYTSEGRKKDAFRTEVIEGFMVTVLRFPNRRVDEEIQAVIKEIRSVAASLPKRNPRTRALL